ncbi:MAG: portal protein [Rhodospirillaceae bacterium]
MEKDVSYMADELEQLVNPDVMDETELQSIIGKEIDDAVDYIDNTISPARAKATEYYRGQKFGDEEEGRSQVVSMDVRDTVQAILPSLMRIFHSSDRTVEYSPTSEEDVAAAEQATDYANFIINKDNEGFLSTYSAFKDALIRKVGVLKCWWDDQTRIEAYNYSGLDDAALAALAANPDAEIIIQSSEPIGEPMQDPVTGEMMPVPMVHDVRVEYIKPDGRVKLEAVPPEEFLISREAKSVSEAEYVGHRRIVTVSELISMGYSEEEVEGLASAHDDMNTNMERRTRNPSLTNEMNSRDDAAMRKVMYVENYIRVDYDGDGVAELRKVCTAGDGNKILMNEPCTMAPFATFCPDPEPHDMFGMSAADVVMDIQRIKSVIMRNTLDSLAMSIHPRVAVVEGMVNIEDVMNTEVGSIIRQRAAGQVQPLSMPFVGQQAFPVLQYMDQVKEARTGISKASSGLDANALQSSTATAVAATVNAAQQHIELIARIFAETGMKQLYKLVLHLITTHQDAPRMIRLRNEFVPIDPAAWNANMDVNINVALGRGSDTERMMMLRQIGEMQKEAMTTMGAQNPLTDISKLSNTLKAMTELAGFKDTSMFWGEPSEFVPPPQDDKPDINEMLIQVQIQQIQADIQKKAAELQLEREKIMMDDDRKRDELDAELFVKAEEMKAKYGTALNVEKIRADMAINREVMKAQGDVIKGAVNED